MPKGIDPHRRQTDLRNEKEWEESGLNDYTKGVLKQLGQDANIDAQHPLIDQSARVKAYFTDVYDEAYGGYSPNTDETSRLDNLLNSLEKKGEIKADEKAEIKSDTLRHWEQNTLPEELQTQSIKESIFKISKLTTRR